MIIDCFLATDLQIVILLIQWGLLIFSYKLLIYHPFILQRFFIEIYD